MLERLSKGFEHKNADEVVDEAIEIGDLNTLKKLKIHEHPSVRGRYLSDSIAFFQQHPRFALGTAALIGSITIIVGFRNIKVHERSAQQLQEETIQTFADPLLVSFGETLKLGEVAINKELGEQFMDNLFKSSIRNTKKAEQFWGSLNPYHPIFNELLDPQTEKTEQDRDASTGLPSSLPLSHPRKTDPQIHFKYKPGIDSMIAKLKADPDKINKERGAKIEKAINGKLNRRSI